ncbi:uncharacterized protein N7446_007133 [Penicillium canescens]|uniref:Uncharacterized protein n=1 Tax=Penicillium canescens TaxID=5083 RepID=A0AAD6IL13_PENCN|nr:uncharacterized protein N7446_007133 [Penicillium canescens]KAJ6049541.1 hypothetical protein N7444_006257 [Penicillium canescens]KAJ6052492.1 hypothetical protein N7460_003026 [Penicillium canescens]KAJ6063013.1 hypothetical protein N7446_007133 [Penicillium canescens]
MLLIPIPDRLRVALTILTALSFLPQLHRIRTQKTSKGISTDYVFWNLLCATEQFKFFVYLLIAKDPEQNIPLVYDPPTFGDRLNMYQTAVVWLSFFTLFCACLRHTPSKPFYVIAYALYIPISIIPPILDILYGFPSPDHTYGDPLASGIFFLSMCLLNPLVTVLVVYAVFSQIREIKSARSPELSSPPGNALSICGLAAQAVVFAAVAFTWIWRVPIENARLGWGTWSWPVVALDNLMYWYDLVGFPAFDNGVFAMGQGVLFVLAWRRGKGRENAVDREREPLLGGSVDRATKFDPCRNE